MERPPRRPLGAAPLLLAVAIAGVLAAGILRLVTFESVPVTGAPTPSGALEAYYEALADGSCRGAARYVHPDFLTADRLCETFEATVEASGTLVGIDSAKVGEESATLIAERDVDGVRDRRIVRARRTGDLWRLAGGSSCYPATHPTDLGTSHLEEGQEFDDYSSIPPTSGPHAPAPAESGTVYPEPQPLPALVHAMEHGTVVFWVGEAAQAFQEQLLGAVEEAYAEGYRSVIVTPLPDLEVPFAMTAWGTLQRCLGVSSAEIRSFLERYYASGGEGALACSGPAARVPPCRGDAETA